HRQHSPFIILNERHTLHAPLNHVWERGWIERVIKSQGRNSWMPSWNSLKNSVVLPKLNLKMALFTQNIAMALGVVIFEIIGLALYPIVFTSITSANVGGKVIGSN